MNQYFFKKIENILHEERIDAYRQDGADPALTLARYSLNMALGESLYPALQFAEVALRNAISGAPKPMNLRHARKPCLVAAPHILLADFAKLDQAIKANFRGLGYGG